MRDVNAILLSTFRQSTEDNFRSKFTPAGPDDCWEWNGTLHDAGYGLLSVWLGYQYGNEGAHRLSWLFHNGPLPVIPGFGTAHILHKCDNPPCVNPRHLFPGTQKDNNQDKSNKGRAPRGETHPHTKLTDDDVKMIKSSPESHRKLARQYGVSDATITGIKRGKRWKHVEAPTLVNERVYATSENHASAKMTREQAIAILADTRNNSVVAREFGVAVPTIWKLRKGKTWKDLPRPAT